MLEEEDEGPGQKINYLYRDCKQRFVTERDYVG